MRRALPFAAFLAVIVFYLAGILVGPRVPDALQEKYCSYNVHIAGPFGHSLNCDSPAFLADAADPGRITAPQGRRQDRPGAGLTVHIISQPFVWALHAAGFDGLFETSRYTEDRKAENPRESQIDPKRLLPYYLGFFLLNILVLGGAYALYLKAIGLPLSMQSFTRASAWMGLPVVANNITKQYFWSPHTQSFNILALMGALYVFQALQSAQRPFRLFWIFSLCCGIGMLYYGVFLVPAAVAGLGLLWRMRETFLSGGIVRTGTACIFGMVLFALPYGLWYAYMVHLNGAFYHHDVEDYHGFHWITDMIREDGWASMVSKFGAYFTVMMSGFLAQGWGLILLLPCLVYAAKQTCGKTGVPSFLWASTGLYALLYVLFFTAYGLTTARISEILVIALTVLCGAALRPLEHEKYVRPAAIAALCLYLVYSAVKFGPYS